MKAPLVNWVSRAFSPLTRAFGQHASRQTLERRLSLKIGWIFLVSITATVILVSAFVFLMQYTSNREALARAERLLISTLATDLQFFDFAATKSSLDQFNEILKYRQIVLEDRYGTLRAETGTPADWEPDKTLPVYSEDQVLVGRLKVWAQDSWSAVGLNLIWIPAAILMIALVLWVTRAAISRVLRTDILKPMARTTELIANTPAGTDRSTQELQSMRAHPEFRAIMTEYLRVYRSLLEQSNLIAARQIMLTRVLREAGIAVSYINNDQTLRELSIGAEPPAAIRSFLADPGLDAPELLQLIETSGLSVEDALQSPDRRAEQIADYVIEVPSDTTTAWALTQLRFDVGSALLAKDITRQRRAEIELRRAHKMEALGILSSGFAHDFNNLLSVAMGALELIEMKLGDDDDDLHAGLDLANKSVRRASTIAHNLLAYARENKGKTELIEPDLLFETLEGFMKSGERSGIDFEFVCKGNNLIRVDKDMLESALLNLMINSGHAMGGSGRIMVTHRDATPDEIAQLPNPETRAAVSILVRDEGPGIPEELIGKVVDPFFTTKAKNLGTGLGLSMAVHFAEQAGGRLKLENVEGGFQATLIIPSSVDDAQPDSPDLDVAAEMSRAKTILVVDDNLELLEMISQLARHAGHHCMTVSTVAEALRMINQEDLHIDVLLTDHNLPDGKGKEVAEAFRQASMAGKCILMSGVRGHKDTDGCFDLIMLKPFSFKDFMANL